VSSPDGAVPQAGARGLGVKASPGENPSMGQGDNTTGGSRGSTRDKSTTPGLKMERKKIVTKRGLVAPSPENPKRVEEFIPTSDRVPNQESSPMGGVARRTARFGSDTPGSTPAEPMPADSMPAESGPAPHHLTRASENLLDETRELATDPQASERPLSPAEVAALEGYRKWAPEDFTPNEGSDLGEWERARFQTEPGGGKNRVSGGRLQARAYVSPVTVKPSTGNTPITAAIKVHDIVENAVRAYQTEPSLLRRRQSSLPPRPGSNQERLRVLMGGAAAIILLGAVIFWITLRGAERVTPPFPEAAVPTRIQSSSHPEPKPAGSTQEEPEDTGEAAQEDFKASTPPPPAPAPAPQEPAPKKTAPAALPRTAPAPVAAPAPAAVRAPAAAPAQQSQKKPKDLWLE
jgi:hypothetical protein